MSAVELVTIWNGINDGQDGDLLVPVNWADQRTKSLRQPAPLGVSRVKRQNVPRRKFLQAYKQRLADQRDLEACYQRAKTVGFAQ